METNELIAVIIKKQLDLEDKHKELNTLITRLKEQEATFNVQLDYDRFTRRVANACANAFKVDSAKMQSRIRDKNIVAARQVYFWLISKKTDWTLDRIAESLNKLDPFNHATIIHSRNKVKDSVWLLDHRGISDDIAVVAKTLDKQIDRIDYRDLVA